MDQLSQLYQELIEDQYDCVDRVVLNAYFYSGQYPAGFRTWWRALSGSDDDLDTNHLMRLAGRFSRRLRAFAKERGIPVINCSGKDEKFEISAEYLKNHDGQPGLFLILVSRASAVVWEVEKTPAGKIANLRRKMPFVNHYSFHIWDAQWGHIIIKMSGHPPFGAQIILNGHEYVAVQARQNQLPCAKEGNCFVEISDATRFAQLADTLSEPATEGRLREVCDRWIYSTCLIFGLNREEQDRSGFRYGYSTYQIEYSRNLRFLTGFQMEQVFQALIDRNRARLTLDRIKTIFGFKHRPHRKRKSPKSQRWGVTVEKPAYDVTIFKVHYGKLTLKIYSKGERVLRVEVMVHNTGDLPYTRQLCDFPKIVQRMKGMLENFLNALYCIEASFISDDTLEKLPEHSQVGHTRVGGVDFNRPRMRRVMGAVLALSTAPSGFTAAELAAKVRGDHGLEASAYGPRQAAYDLKKLRGKDWLDKPGRSRRYQAKPPGLRAMSALFVLRDKVIQPLLAAHCRLTPGRPPIRQAPIDAHYQRLQHHLRDLFQDLGLVA
jgi:hypothetical protein